jgi:S-DNA-T family DNA segregation ATPase FtsK/SpoIIIE
MRRNGATYLELDMAHGYRGSAARSHRQTSFMPPGLAASLRRRGRQLVGLVLLAAGLALALGLVSFDPGDPSFNRATADPAQNLLGRPGAYTADLLLQTIGIAGALLALVPAVWGWRLMTGRMLAPVWIRLTLVPIAVITAAIAFAAIPVPESWPLRAGLGGVAGALLLTGAGKFAAMLALEIGPAIIGAGAGVLALAALSVALAMTGREWLTGGAVAGRGLWRSLALSGRGVARLFRRRRGPRPPRAGRAARAKSEEPSSRRRGSTIVAERAERAEPRLNIRADATPGPEPRAAKRSQTPARSRVAPRQASLALGGDYALPALDLLNEPPATAAAAAALDEAALNHNAQMLESVLEDFGIGGQVTKVRPGPVVTLYEFEPAPGTKSSRIVNLSDDIARSMSAVSVRVAVIPGRTVLGIELPNADREMVFLRELLASNALERAKAALGLMLGKDIGGAPVVADLERMPHLLIAGTTGSGKSVAINTMILSLLYRLTPEQCKFIMIDPKMLELAVYDDIPHLLAPVVTDPRKAIVALKWVVREMEERYQAMSKLGVRNIMGFNTRLAEARRKREVLKKRVQTGFDPDSGRPIYEEQELDLTPLPYIVVVVDEMADLMLVAGKDIEMAVQRLAQMARAAGIHLIMATQRPSVDVITGTIKANFPTRVSFQVTSKIDSRTILGEQGAEQLLGQGDMLYMAGGGRITRVHGPFVTDGEVEEVVRFLKSQGQPDYIEEVTESDEAGGFGGLDLGSGSGGADEELYHQAVAVVARERKASTSFIQRHLQIGYNRAARLIERMEAEGIVSQANHAGKREVLIGEG